MKTFSAVLLGVALIASPVLADTVIAPGSAGNAQGPAPLRYYGDSGSRVQQIYDGSFFSGPVEISGLSFRAYPGAAPSGFFSNSVSVSDILVRLSTTAVSANEASGLQPSATFASNLGADLTTVYSGALTLTTAATGTGPQPFDYTINFASPFSYNPAGGNLLLDVLIPVGASVSGGGFGFLTFDNANTNNDGVRSIVEINSGGATQGFLDTSAAITAFETTAAVPEPSAWALMIGGFMLTGSALRMRRRAAAVARVA
jgi:hypothetical protein